MNRDVGESIRFGAEGGDVVVTDSMVFAFDNQVEVSTVTGTSEKVSSREVVVQKHNRALGITSISSLLIAIFLFVIGGAITPQVNNYLQLTGAEQTRYDIGMGMIRTGAISAAIFVVSFMAFSKSEKRVKSPLYVVTLHLPFGKTVSVPFVDSNRASRFHRAVQTTVSDSLTKPAAVQLAAVQLVEVRHIEMAVQKQRCLYCETLYAASLHGCPNCAAPAKLVKV